MCVAQQMLQMVRAKNKPSRPGNGETRVCGNAQGKGNVKVPTNQQRQERNVARVCVAGNVSKCAHGSACARGVCVRGTRVRVAKGKCR